MARYDKSWKTNIKTMFADLPVEYMAQKLNGIEQEKNYTDSLLDGDFAPNYDPLLNNADLISKKRQQYKDDLGQLRNSMIGSIDFNSTVNDINKIRDQYGLTNGTGINYSQNVNSGTGGSGTGGGSARSNKKYNTGAQYVPGSLGDKLEANKKEADETVKYYMDQKDPNADAYVYHYLDKERKKIYDATGGDPDKQGFVRYDKVGIYDEKDMVSAVTSMSKGFSADGTAALQKYGAYVGIGKSLFVTEDDVRGDEYSGVFGYIWQNANWNQHQDIMYEYGTEKTKKIDANQYANYWLQTQVETNIKNSYKNKYGANWKNKYYSDLNNGLLNDQFKQDINNKIQADKAQLKKDHPDWTDDQIMQELVVQDYGRKGYKYNQAETLTNVQVRREAFHKNDITGLRESAETRLRIGKSLIDYENESTFSVAGTSPVILPDDQKEKEKEIKNLYNEQQLLKNGVIAATTKFNNAKKGFFGLFAKNDDQGTSILNVKNFGINNTQKDFEDKMIDVMIDNDFYIRDSKGNLAFNPDKIENFKKFTANPNLTVRDAWEVALNYNNAQTELNVRRRDQFNTEYLLTNMTNQWAVSDQGSGQIDKIWKNMGGGLKDKTIIEVNGVQKTVNKKDLPALIQQGAVIRNPNGRQKIVSDGYGGYHYVDVDPTTNTVDLSKYQKQVAKWSANPDNTAGQNQLTFISIGDVKKVKSLHNVRTNMMLLSTPQTAASVTNIHGESVVDMAADKGFITGNNDMTYELVIAEPATGSGDNGLTYGFTYKVTGWKGKGKDKKKVTENISFLTDERGLNNVQGGAGTRFADGYVQAFAYQANSMENTNPWTTRDAYNKGPGLLHQAVGTAVVNRHSIFSHGVDLINAMLNNPNVSKTGVVRSQDGFDFYYEQENGYAVPFAKDIQTGISYDLTLEPSLNLNPVENGSGAVQQQGLLYSRNVSTNLVNKKDLATTIKYKNN